MRKHRVGAPLSTIRAQSSPRASSTPHCWPWPAPAPPWWCRDDLTSSPASGEHTPDQSEDCIIKVDQSQSTHHPPLPETHPRQGGVQGGHLGPWPRECHRPVSCEAVLKRPEHAPVLSGNKLCFLLGKIYQRRLSWGLTWWLCSGCRGYHCSPPSPHKARVWTPSPRRWSSWPRRPLSTSHRWSAPASPGRSVWPWAGWHLLKSWVLMEDTYCWSNEPMRSFM